MFAAIFSEYRMYVFVLLGLLTGIPAVWVFRERANLRPPGVVLLCILYSVSSVLSAMLFAQLEFLISGKPSTGLGAVSTYGIYFIGSLMMIGVSRVFRWKTAGVMDIYALYAMPSMIMLRINCLMAGCCGGLPLYDTGYKWPTRESEIVFYIVMFLVFWVMLRKNQIPGQLFPMLMVSYGVFRFINQWFRDTGQEGFHMSHAWSILCTLIGLTLLFEVRGAKESKKRKNKKRH